jgi:hypothetical protein
MLKFAGFEATHSGHSSHSSNVIHIALGVNVLVNERCRCSERRIVMLLLYTGRGSATRPHDVRLRVSHILRYYISRMRFIVRPSSVVVNWLYG